MHLHKVILALVLLWFVEASPPDLLEIARSFPEYRKATSAIVLEENDSAIKVKLNTRNGKPIQKGTLIVAVEQGNMNDLLNMALNGTSDEVNSKHKSTILTFTPNKKAISVQKGDTRFLQKRLDTFGKPVGNWRIARFSGNISYITGDLDLESLTKVMQQLGSSQYTIKMGVDINGNLLPIAKIISKSKSGDHNKRLKQISLHNSPAKRNWRAYDFDRSSIETVFGVDLPKRTKGHRNASPNKHDSIAQLRNSQDKVFIQQTKDIDGTFKDARGQNITITSGNYLSLQALLKNRSDFQKFILGLEANLKTFDVNDDVELRINNDVYAGGLVSGRIAIETFQLPPALPPVEGDFTIRNIGNIQAFASPNRHDILINCNSTPIQLTPDALREIMEDMGLTSPEARFSMRLSIKNLMYLSSIRILIENPEQVSSGHIKTWMGSSKSTSLRAGGKLPSDFFDSVVYGSEGRGSSVQSKSGPVKKYSYAKDKIMGNINKCYKPNEMILEDSDFIAFQSRDRYIIAPKSHDADFEEYMYNRISAREYSKIDEMMQFIRKTIEAIASKNGATWLCYKIRSDQKSFGHFHWEIELINQPYRQPYLTKDTGGVPGTVPSAQNQRANLWRRVENSKNSSTKIVAKTNTAITVLGLNPTYGRIHTLTMPYDGEYATFEDYVKKHDKPGQILVDMYKINKANDLFPLYAMWHDGGINTQDYLHIHGVSNKLIDGYWPGLEANVKEHIARGRGRDVVEMNRRIGDKMRDQPWWRKLMSEAGWK